MANPLAHPVHQHVLDEDVINASEERHTSVARDTRQAKLILQECSGDSGDSVYDHMTALLKRILSDRPPNVIDYFEEYSRSVRQERLNMNENRLRKTFIEPERLTSAQFLMPMLRKEPPADFNDFRPASDRAEEAAAAVDDDDDEARVAGHDAPLSDVMHLQFYWQLAGFGFPAGHVYLLSCSLRQLSESPAVETCRFWGQMNGIERNYLVAEVDLVQDELEKRNIEELQELDAERQHFDAAREQQLAAVSKTPDDLMPKRPTTPVYETLYEYPPPRRNRLPVAGVPFAPYLKKRQIPGEISGTGLNRKTYFVCTRLGGDWIELPPVTPQQVRISRQIRKFLTGNLDAQLWSYPTFPGVERNYLRALIARITSGTYVAPNGFYRIGAGGAGEEEEEEEVDEEGHNNDKPTSADPGYEPMSPKDLLQMHGWTHYRPNILRQGRINWFNPKDLEEKEETEEENDEDEDEEAGGGGDDDEDGSASDEEEIGPGLLTPCSEDRNGKWPVWQLKRAQNFNPSQSMVVMHSLLWPGAVAFAQLRNQDCLYVGWGQKFVCRNVSPIAIPSIQSEYVIGPEIMEVTDPTVEEEDLWRRLHAPPQPYEEMNEEGEGEGEEEDGNAADGQDEY